MGRKGSNSESLKSKKTEFSGSNIIPSRGSAHRRLSGRAGVRGVSQTVDGKINSIHSLGDLFRSML